MNLYDPFKNEVKIKGTFIVRSNRFVVKCDIDGEIFDCHLPNPGRLWELLFPGVTLFLVENRGGKTAYTAIAVDTLEGPVLLHTHKANDLVEELLKNREIPSFREKKPIKREISVGKSRFDFLLKGNSRPTLLEVKSCTLFGKRGSMFPDAPSERAVRHVKELEHLSSEGYDAAVIFVVQSRKPEWFLPDFHTDPKFADAIYHARDRIEVVALSVPWRSDLTLSESPVELPIPWEKMRDENEDRGTSLIVYDLTGADELPPGHYVLVVETDENLSSATTKAVRKRRRIVDLEDRLNSQRRSVKTIPIRSSKKLGRRIYEQLYPLSSMDEGIAKLSYDGRWLLRFEESPFLLKDFVDVVVANRIDRLS